MSSDTQVILTQSRNVIHFMKFLFLAASIRPVWQALGKTSVAQNLVSNESRYFVALIFARLVKVRSRNFQLSEFRILCRPGPANAAFTRISIYTYGLWTFGDFLVLPHIEGTNKLSAGIFIGAVGVKTLLFGLRANRGPFLKSCNGATSITTIPICH